MDVETLVAYRDLWVPEPKSTGGTYSTLTAGEQRALERIRAEGNVRLEQERIAWGFALAQLVVAAEVDRFEYPVNDAFAGGATSARMIDEKLRAGTHNTDSTPEDTVASGPV